MYRCRGCKTLRKEVSPEWSGCRKRRLCDEVDVALIDRFPGRSLDTLRLISRRIEEGAASAAFFLQEQRAFPQSHTEMRALLLELHRRLFDSAIPDIAGRFRRADEGVEFGGAQGNSNRLIGSKPGDIESDLERTFRRCRLHEVLAAEKPVLVRACASFLERFFRVHPFVDGNGRVARLVVRHACEVSGRYYVEPFTTKRRSRREYVSALEYAHRHAQESDDPKKRFIKNPYVYVARWLERHVQELPSDALLEAESPDGADA